MHHFRGPDVEQVEDTRLMLGRMFIEERAGDGDVTTAEGQDHPMQDIPIGLWMGQTPAMLLLLNSTLAIEESTLCRPRKSGQALSGN
jgi:hypothetical protein